MAGDWLKIRTDLVDDPDVFTMSEVLSIDCPTVVGHLVTFWGWLDRHTEDGNNINLTDSMINKKVGCENFATALREVNWLSGENMALSIPHHERHNGNTAKARALEAEAKRLRRRQTNSPTDVGQPSDKKQPKSPTREEKRRVYTQHTQTERKSSIGNHFSPDDDLIEFARMRPLLPDPTDQRLIDDFVTRNQSSDWQSANWQAEYKKYLAGPFPAKVLNPQQLVKPGESNEHSSRPGKADSHLKAIRDLPDD